MSLFRPKEIKCVRKANTPPCSNCSPEDPRCEDPVSLKPLQETVYQTPQGTCYNLDSLAETLRINGRDPLTREELEMHPDFDEPVVQDEEMSDGSESYEEDYEEGGEEEEPLVVNGTPSRIYAMYVPLAPPSQFPNAPITWYILPIIPSDYTFPQRRALHTVIINSVKRNVETEQMQCLYYLLQSVGEFTSLIRDFRIETVTTLQFTKESVDDLMDRYENTDYENSLLETHRSYSQDTMNEEAQLNELSRDYNILISAAP